MICEGASKDERLLGRHGFRRSVILDNEPGGLGYTRMGCKEHVDQQGYIHPRLLLFDAEPQRLAARHFESAKISCETVDRQIKTYQGAYSVLLKQSGSHLDQVYTLVSSRKYVAINDKDDEV